MRDQGPTGGMADEAAPEQKEPLGRRSTHGARGACGVAGRGSTGWAGVCTEDLGSLLQSPLPKPQGESRSRVPGEAKPGPTDAGTGDRGDGPAPKHVQ